MMLANILLALLVASVSCLDHASTTEQTTVTCEPDETLTTEGTCIPVSDYAAEDRRVINIPKLNCPIGYTRDIAGNCILIFSGESPNKIVPQKPCKKGEIHDINGNCVPSLQKLRAVDDKASPDNIITVPCAPGFQEINGHCVAIFDSIKQKPASIIDVPPFVCPDGFIKDINGVCVEEW